MPLQFFTDIQACAGLRGAEYDACMIRKGFQESSPGHWERSTGLQISPAQILPFVPVIGDIAAAVGSAVGAVKTSLADPPTTLQTPGAAAMIPAPSNPVAASSPAALDTNMMLLLGGGAILLLFLLRR